LEVIIWRLVLQNLEVDPPNVWRLVLQKLAGPLKEAGRHFQLPQFNRHFDDFAGIFFRGMYQIVEERFYFLNALPPPSLKLRKDKP